MRIEEGRFPSTGGMADIHTVTWLPEGEPIAVIQIVHGMQEYAARYTDMARWFCEKGYAVCAADHLGHGESLIDGQLGYFGEKNTSQTLVDDVHAFRKLSAPRFAGKPYFIFGHSMGSFITRVYLTQYADGLAGAILSGTAGPTPMARIAKPVLRRMWSRHGGTWTDEALAARIPTAYNKRFAAEGRDNAWLSSDGAVSDRFNSDPLTQFWFSISALWTLLDLLDRVSRRSWPKQVPASLPILLTAGADDPVGAYGEGVRTLYDRMMQRGFDDLDISIYPDCRHELHNETNREQVFCDWLAWLEAHQQH
jgi:alpha-beta hydrolase superfamily lysophospholipase